MLRHAGKVLHQRVQAQGLPKILGTVRRISTQQVQSQQEANEAMRFSVADFNRLIRHRDVMGAFSMLMQARKTLKTLPSSMWSALLEQLALSRAPITLPSSSSKASSTTAPTKTPVETLDYMPLTPAQRIDKVLLFREVYRACILDTGITWTHAQWASVILEVARAGDASMVKALLDHYSRVYPLVRSAAPMTPVEAELSSVRQAARQWNEARYRAALLMHEAQNAQSDSNQTDGQSKVPPIEADEDKDASLNPLNLTFNPWKELSINIIAHITQVKLELSYFELEPERGPDALLNAFHTFVKAVLTPVYDADGKEKAIGAHSLPVTADQKQLFIVLQIVFEALVRQEHLDRAIELFESVFVICKNSLEQRARNVARYNAKRKEHDLSEEEQLELKELGDSIKAAHLRAYQYNVQKVIHRMHLRLMRHYFTRNNTEAMVELVALLHRHVAADRTGTIPLAANTCFKLIVESLANAGEDQKAEEWKVLAKEHEAQILLAAALEKEHLQVKLGEKPHEARNQSPTEKDDASKRSVYSRRRVRLYDPDTELYQRQFTNEILKKTEQKEPANTQSRASDEMLLLNGRRRALARISSEEALRTAANLRQHAEKIGHDLNFAELEKFLNKELANPNYSETCKSRAFLKLIRSMDKAVSKLYATAAVATHPNALHSESSSEASVLNLPQSDSTKKNSATTSVKPQNLEAKVEEELNRVLSTIPFASEAAIAKLKLEIERRLVREASASTFDKVSQGGPTSQLIEPESITPLAIDKELKWNLVQPGHILGLIHAGQLAGIQLSAFHVAAAMSLLLKLRRTSLLALRLLADANRLGLIQGVEFSEGKNTAFIPSAKLATVRGSMALYEVLLKACATKIAIVAPQIRATRHHSFKNGQASQMNDIESLRMEILLAAELSISPFQIAATAKAQGVPLSPAAITSLIVIAAQLEDWSAFYKYIELGLAQHGAVGGSNVVFNHPSGLIVQMSVEKAAKARYLTRITAADMLAQFRLVPEFMQMIREIEINEKVRLLSADTVDHYFPELNSRTPWSTVLTTTIDERKLTEEDLVISHGETKQNDDLETSLMGNVEVELNERQVLEQEKERRLKMYGTRYEKWQHAQQRLIEKANAQRAAVSAEKSVDTTEDATPEDEDEDDLLFEMDSLYEPDFGRGVNVHLTGNPSDLGSLGQQERRRQSEAGKPTKSSLLDARPLSLGEPDEETKAKAEQLKERLADLELQISLAKDGMMGKSKKLPSSDPDDDDEDDLRFGSGPLPEDLANERDAEEGEIEFVDNGSDSELDEDWSDSDLDYLTDSDTPDLDSLLENFGDPNYAKMYTQLASNAPVKTIRELVIDQERDRILRAASRDPSLALASFAASRSASRAAAFTELANLVSATPSVRAMVVAKHAMQVAQRLKPWQRYKYNVWLVDKGLSLVQSARLTRSLGNEAMVNLHNKILSVLSTSRSLPQSISRTAMDGSSHSSKRPQSSFSHSLLFRAQRELMEAQGIVPNAETLGLAMRVATRGVLSHSRQPVVAVEPTVRTLSLQPPIPQQSRSASPHQSQSLEPAPVAAVTLESVLHQREISWKDHPVRRALGGQLISGMRQVDQVLEELVARNLSLTPRVWHGLANEALQSGMPFVALPMVVAAIKSHFSAAAKKKERLLASTQRAVDKLEPLPFVAGKVLNMNASEQYVAQMLADYQSVYPTITEMFSLQLKLVSTLDGYLSAQIAPKLQLSARTSDWAGQLKADNHDAKTQSNIGGKLQQIITGKSRDVITLSSTQNGYKLEYPAKAFVDRGLHGPRLPSFVGKLIIDPFTGVVRPVNPETQLKDLATLAAVSLRLALHTIESTLPILAPNWHDTTHGASWAVDSRLTPTAGSQFRAYLHTDELLPAKAKSQSSASVQTALQLRALLAPQLRESAISFVGVVRKYLLAQTWLQVEGDSTQIGLLTRSEYIRIVRVLAAIDHLELAPVVLSYINRGAINSTPSHAAKEEMNFLRQLLEGARMVKALVPPSEAAVFTEEPRSNTLSNTKHKVAAWITSFANTLMLGHVTPIHLRQGNGAENSVGYASTLVRYWHERQDGLIAALECAIQELEQQPTASTSWTSALAEPFDLSLPTNALIRDYRSSSDPIARLTQSPPLSSHRTK